MIVCQFEHVVSDADFGYWNPSWGRPAEHVFPCGEPATHAVTIADFNHEVGYSVSTEHLCDGHAAMLRAHIRVLRDWVELVSDEPISQANVSTE